MRPLTKKRIKTLSVRIARLSATPDKYGDWWGDDTILHNLPEEIQKKIENVLVGAVEWLRMKQVEDSNKLYLELKERFNLSSELRRLILDSLTKMVDRSDEAFAPLLPKSTNNYQIGNKDGGENERM